MNMANPDALRHTRIPLNHGSGAIPAVGFGTLIPGSLATKQATKTALEVGFRHLDCAERYRNEEIGLSDVTLEKLREIETSASVDGDGSSRCCRPAKLLVIPAKLLVIPAKLLVIPAKAGTQAATGSPLSRG
jgi:hypothetical protein